MGKISTTRIKKRTRNKTNKELVETIQLAKKNPVWLNVSGYLSSSTRNMPEVNLSEIELNSKEGDTIIVPGKVLGEGDITKKLRVCAFKFSHEAFIKLKNKKCETVMLIDEIKKNPKAMGVRVIT